MAVRPRRGLLLVPVRPIGPSPAFIAVCCRPLCGAASTVFCYRPLCGPRPQRGLPFFPLQSVQPARSFDMDFLAPNHHDSESDSEAGQVSRENLQVGARIPCPFFQAQCIGDDMTWRGSKVLRVAALQAGRTDARFVGRWWGSSLTQLGVELGCVSEIGFSNSQLAPLLLEGFSDAGVCSHLPWAS